MNLTHAEHYRWMTEVLAAPRSTFTFAQKAVLVRLALHLNIKSGRCYPSIDTLKGGVALAEDRPVQKTLTKAEKLGWLDRHVGGGRGNTNSYSLREPPAVKTLLSGTPFRETPLSQTLNGDALKGVPPGRKPRPVEHPNTENKKNTESEQNFARWYAVYPKRRARASARKAYDRVIKAGKATIDELIAGATRYAGERRWQDAQFTKDPATWLNGECWADEELLPAAEQRQTRSGAGGRSVPML